jgi:ATP phosphoribosyltransferase
LGGRNLAAVLGLAEANALNLTMGAAVENLRAIFRVLAAHGVLDRFVLDLTEIHDLGYYTGISFEALAPGLGFRLASGGRYDDLVGTFGAPQPAVGLAFGLERLLLARQVRQPAAFPLAPAPDLLVSTDNDPAALAAVDAGRELGLHLLVDLEHRRERALCAAARALRAPYALEWVGDCAVFYDLGAAAPQATPVGQLYPALELMRRLLVIAEEAAERRNWRRGCERFCILTLALPKGRLAEQSLKLMAAAGLPQPGRDAGRKLVLASDDGAMRFILAKPVDVPTYVEYGAADVGVCGLDTLRESRRYVYEPLLLPFGHCRLSLAAPAARPDLPLRYESQPRVATKYPNLTADFFRARGVNAEIITLNGSVELGPLVGLADLIVDLVETGDTLRENGLAEIRTIMHSQAVLIVNRAAYHLKAAAMRHLIDALRAAVENAA